MYDDQEPLGLVDSIGGQLGGIQGGVEGGDQGGRVGGMIGGQIGGTLGGLNGGMEGGTIGGIDGGIDGGLMGGDIGGMMDPIWQELAPLKACESQSCDETGSFSFDPIDESESWEWCTPLSDILLNEEIGCPAPSCASTVDEDLSPWFESVLEGNDFPLDEAWTTFLESNLEDEAIRLLPSVDTETSLADFVELEDNIECEDGPFYRIIDDDVTDFIDNEGRIHLVNANAYRDEYLEVDLRSVKLGSCSNLIGDNDFVRFNGKAINLEIVLLSRLHLENFEFIEQLIIREQSRINLTNISFVSIPSDNPEDQTDPSYIEPTPFIDLTIQNSVITLTQPPEKKQLQTQDANITIANSTLSSNATFMIGEGHTLRIENSTLIQQDPYTPLFQSNGGQVILNNVLILNPGHTFVADQGTFSAKEIYTLNTTEPVLNLETPLLPFLQTHQVHPLKIDVAYFQHTNPNPTFSSVNTTLHLTHVVTHNLNHIFDLFWDELSDSSSFIKNSRLHGHTLFTFTYPATSYMLTTSTEDPSCLPQPQMIVDLLQPQEETMLIQPSFLIDSSILMTSSLGPDQMGQNDFPSIQWTGGGFLHAQNTQFQDLLFESAPFTSASHTLFSFNHSQFNQSRFRLHTGRAFINHSKGENTYIHTHKESQIWVNQSRFNHSETFLTLDGSSRGFIQESDLSSSTLIHQKNEANPDELDLENSPYTQICQTNLNSSPAAMNSPLFHIQSGSLSLSLSTLVPSTSLLIQDEKTDVSFNSLYVSPPMDQEGSSSTSLIETRGKLILNQSYLYSLVNQLSTLLGQGESQIVFNQSLLESQGTHTLILQDRATLEVNQGGLFGAPVSLYKSEESLVRTVNDMALPMWADGFIILEEDEDLTEVQTSLECYLGIWQPSCQFDPQDSTRCISPTPN